MGGNLWYTENGEVSTLLFGGVFRVEIMVGLVCQEFWFSASYMRIYGGWSSVGVFRVGVGDEKVEESC